MIRLLVFIAIVFLPRLILSLFSVPQALVRGVTVSTLVLLCPVAIAWFGLKSQMIRPGGKLYQPKFDSVRPKIERNIRILVLAFGVFFVYFLTLPVTHDLIELHASQTPIRVTETVRRVDSGYRTMGIEETVSFSESAKDGYLLWYPTKPIRVGSTYEFVVLPKSRTILDYAELPKSR